MPDPIKLATLQLAGYSITPSCAICVHGIFKPGSSWGSCQRLSYQHLKHTEIKPPSVFSAGCCDEIVIRSEVIADLTRSGFQVFLQGPSE